MRRWRTPAQDNDHGPPPACSSRDDSHSRRTSDRAMLRPTRASVLLLAAALSGCSGGKDAAAPIRNVLLVTFDTTRADHLGSLGWPQAHTPVLDGLAKSGVLFEQCIAAAPITLPSHA